VKNEGKDGENIAEGAARSAADGGGRRKNGDAATYALPYGKESGEGQRKIAAQNKKPPSNAAAVFEP
jgi:hypothetical protein